jgi:glycosyltransferase involved in cell wall biosynthesis
MQISFIIPSRNNLKYVQQAYKSIRESNGFHHEIVLLDDASNDGTWEWMQNI